MTQVLGNYSLHHHLSMDKICIPCEHVTMVYTLDYELI